MKYLIGLFCLLFVPFFSAQTFSLRDTIINHYDYIVITVPDFVPACESFKNHKILNRGYKVLVVDTAQVYKDFSTYSNPADRIEQFLQYIGTHWKNPQPKYILFAGDITKVPAWRLPTVGDDSVMFGIAYKDQPYMSKFYDSLNSACPYSVGRVAALTTDELSNYFNKVINYECDTIFHGWNNRVTFISASSHGYPSEASDLENICGEISTNYFPEYFYKKIISRVDSSAYYGNTSDILDEVNDKKTSTLYFCGGATAYSFSADSLFTLNDILNIHNDSTPFFMYFCVGQRFSADSVGSLLDACILKSNGAIGGFAPVCPAFSTLTFDIQRKLFSSLYFDKKSIGDSWWDFSRYNHDEAYSAYAIFGDPSLKPKFSPLLAASEPTTPVMKYALYQNYPNPFNPSTTIKYSVADNGLVSLAIYNQLGQRVAELYHGEKQSGTYSVTWNAIGFPSGVYFCELKTTHYREVKKLLLVK